MANNSSSGPEPAKKQLDDLAPELLGEIFKHSYPSDLLALSRVSKHCRDIAAAQMYKKFHVVFPDDDDMLRDSIIDELAGGLETFVTSEYDYNHHVKEVIIETASGGDKAERSYRHYHFHLACGRFMNTLFVLWLRKTVNLETFKWDIRVELSRKVFKALHGNSGLKHLHLRMHHGSSSQESRAGLPHSVVFSTTSTPITNHAPHSHPPLPNINMVPVTILSSTLSPFPPPGEAIHYMVGNQAVSTGPKNDTVKAKLPQEQKQEPTLSGFKDLQSLAILDLGTLDYLGELKICVQNSSKTLKSLSLSFSESLATKSQKPPPEPHADSDSEQEDEFGQMIPMPGLPPGGSDTNNAMKVHKAKIEKKKHEAFLAEVFGLNSSSTTPPPVPEATIQPEAPVTRDDARKAFMRGLAPLAQFFKASGDEAREKGFDVIYAASKKFLEEIDAIDGANVSAQLDSPDTAAATSDTAAPTTNGVEDTSPGLFDEPARRKVPTADPDVSNPDDIDVESPEDSELVIESGEPETDADAEAETGDTNGEKEWANEVVKAAPEAAETARHEYVRSTRGLPLETLAICLIPVRASTLDSAIDINELQEITLLNVGSQTAFWHMLATKYQPSKLGLRKIYTDHVTIEFLAFVNQLESVEELLLLERVQKIRVDNTTVKTTVTLEQIRKAVLKKHVNTLKVLMLHNLSSIDWDLDNKTTMLLCQRGRAMEELSANFSIRILHTILQFLPNMASLRALHVRIIRPEDSCATALIEYRKFAADSLSFCPQNKLEYLGVDSIVQRLVRHIPVKKPGVDKEGKGKEKIPAIDKKGKGKKKGGSTLMKELASLGENWFNEMHIKPTLEELIDGYDESDDDVEDDGSHGLRVELVGGLRFCDVSGVRIFAKDIIHGRL